MLENDTSYALLTDLYQLTMAQGYYLNKMADNKACFYGFFRNNPFKGGYTVSCGKDQVLNVLNDFHFTSSDIDYLKSLKTAYDTPLFEDSFLDYLKNFNLSVDVDMVDDGTVVFPHQPTFRVIGPLYQCQLLETPLLNALGFQSLIATKASRIVNAANGIPVSEFGLRRAQGPNGAMSASRAAFVGGVKSVANVAAAKKFNIPTSGTHGHSWIMSFETELEAFRAYAQSNPDNCIFLVDTYNVIEGVKNAITVSKELEKQGKRAIAIRIDSGDLAWLSKKAREMLDDADLGYIGIILTNDLDEYTIEALNQQNAQYTSLGVGTKLVSAYDQPSLGLVYKLSAIEINGKWVGKIKLSEQKSKQSLPGVLNVKRFINNDGIFVGDMIFD
ncbi:MAG: nicotinate phosphoribosyltransferase, partial [Coriobacteriales bacterium]|nr:nicotinate phosphoribosyltransferase [Coriobacteriales bacterium]